MDERQHTFDLDLYILQIALLGGLDRPLACIEATAHHHMTSSSSPRTLRIQGQMDLLRRINHWVDLQNATPPSVPRAFDAPLSPSRPSKD